MMEKDDKEFFYSSLQCSAWQCLQTLQLPFKEVIEFYSKERKILSPYGIFIS